MTQIPYRPMGSQPKIADEKGVAAMFEKLAKHAKPQVSVAMQPPQPKSQPKLLRWKKPVACSDGTVCLDSECGSYRIERRERAGARMYHAMTMHPEFRFELGRRRSADEAKDLCEAAARTASERVSDARCGDGIGSKGE